MLSVLEMNIPGQIPQNTGIVTLKDVGHFSVLEMVANQGDVVILFPLNVMVYYFTEPHLLARKEVRLTLSV